MLQGALGSVSCIARQEKKIPPLRLAQQRGIALLPLLSDHNVLLSTCEKLKQITVPTLERGPGCLKGAVD